QDDRAVRLELVWEVAAVRLELDLRLLSIVIDDRAGSVRKGVAIRRRDRGDEPGIVAARFTLDFDIIGNDVGRLPGGSAMGIAEWADVGRAFLASLLDLA